MAKMAIIFYNLRYFLVKAKGAAVICDNTFFLVNSFSYF